MGVTRMKREMLQSLNSLYSDDETNNFYCLSTILDPCFKLHVFSSSTTVAIAKQMLISEYEQFQLSQASKTDTDPPAAKRSLYSASQEFCNDTIGEKSDYESSTDSVEYVADSYIKELNQEKSDYESSTDSVEYVADSYIKEQNQPRASNPLLYWKDHQCTWPAEDT